MPVLRCRHHNSIHVLVVEHSAHIDHALQASAGERFQFLGERCSLRILYVADVLKLSVFDLGEIPGQARSTLTGANQRQHHLVVRRLRASRNR